MTSPHLAAYEYLNSLLYEAPAIRKHLIQWVGSRKDAKPQRKNTVKPRDEGWSLRSDEGRQAWIKNRKRRSWEATKRGRAEVSKGWRSEAGSWCRARWFRIKKRTWWVTDRFSSAPDADIVNVANMRHLWILPGPIVAEFHYVHHGSTPVSFGHLRMLATAPLSVTDGDILCW